MLTSGEKGVSRSRLPLPGDLKGIPEKKEGGPIRKVGEGGHVHKGRVL